MNLTIVELARAVNKSETYIRQHIHRKHLTVVRDGRKVSVALDEAARWAHERGLSFASPERASLSVGTMKGRTARMTVLMWHAPDAQPRNLFTLMRHRRQEALGPWVSEPDENWSGDEVGDELRLFTLDASLERCQALVDHILDSGTLEIDGMEIHYALESTPRRHWAYRDDRLLAGASMRSPFARHSAEIIEYWSFAAEPPKHWLEVLDSVPASLHPRLKRLGFPLDRRADRIGNLMIAGAEDAIACDLAVHHDRMLRFHVDANELLPGAYRAAVWASHSNDEVLRREVPVTPGQTVIEIASDLDHIGFAIYRAGDGQCVDWKEEFLIMQVSCVVQFDSGPIMHLRDGRGRATHKVNLPGPISTINVHSDNESAKLDKGIRRLWLDRQVHEREAAARREGNFARFQPAEFDQAVHYFIRLLRKDSDRNTPIYLADPYFMRRLKGDKGGRLYLDLFAATTGRPLRILCANRENGNGQPWWSNYPNQITAHVSVRAFLPRKMEKVSVMPATGNVHERQNCEAGFHDRYLITPAQEIVITNSFNGWLKYGVTFASHPYGVYRPEAERLWSMDIESKTTDLLVQKIC